jgi:hypothetical protein
LFSGAVSTTIAFFVVVVVGGYAAVASLFRQFRFYNDDFSYLVTFLFSDSLIGF